MDKHDLKIYVTGQNARSQRAVSTLRQICEACLPDCHTVAVIDVLEQPRLAREQRILATPTVVKEGPPPICRIVGDLSQTRSLLLGLGLPVMDCGDGLASAGDMDHSAA